MNKTTPTNQLTSIKKIYRKPQLTTVGSVSQLTLKLGSLTDGQNPGSFQ